MIEKGRPWEQPAAGPSDVTVEGDDRALAAVVERQPGARVAFRPRASDFARAVGLTDEPQGGVEVSCDALTVEADGVTTTAVNMVVLGTAPDRQRWWSRSRPVLVRVDGRVVHDGAATAVVVGNGQHLRGNDVIPRGHPGDGRVEVQVYFLERRERAAMRARLPRGDHVPHPRIRSASGSEVEVWAAEGIRRLEVDGEGRSPVTEATVTVRPGAFTLLV
jgi:YegS C-terminal NAD kinase beta sandwich-like domain